jgi:hypothetical protein
MNEENDDFNIEEELNELPGYIQSIINDCDTFDKKDCSNQNEEQVNQNMKNDNKENQDKTPQNSQSKTNIINNDNNTNNNNNDNNNDNNNNDINNDEQYFFDEDKENNYNIENIFNSKKDFFNPKTTEKNTNLEENKDKNNESKENLTNSINKDNNNNNNNSNGISVNGGIKLYCIQENNLLNIKRSFRLQSILQNNFNGYQTNTYECSICFRRIQNYGLLSNCDDVFCYDCIKQWRTEAIAKNKREMFRRCPICNCESPMLIKSKNYASGEEKKKKIL